MTNNVIKLEGDGHLFGNFHNYYEFHTENRASIMPEGFLYNLWIEVGSPSKVCLLDIGCNEGNLTLQVLMRAKSELPGVTCCMLGVDIDDVLIQRAQLIREEHDLNFVTLNILENTDYLTSFLDSKNCSSYFFTSCFSVTMWIHMNAGDIGLTNLLCAMGSISSCILLEPQLWKSYKNAIQRCRRRNLPELPHYRNLKIRNISEYATELYISKYNMKVSYDTHTAGWERPVVIYCARS